MKLTDYDINCIGNPNTSYTEGALRELKQAIRKAKEDAEKYHKLNLCNECEQVNKYGIYERKKCLTS